MRAPSAALCAINARPFAIGRIFTDLKSTFKITNYLLGTLCLLALALLSANRAYAFDEDHNEPINGTTLHFRVRGTDKTHPYLLILHGGPGFSSHMFYPWGTALEKDLNVVYLDERGHGESKRYKIAVLAQPKMEEVKGLNIANIVTDIEGVRQFLKVDKWFVLGHSWGGLLGINYVAAHADHLLGYIHMDGLVSVPRMEAETFASAESHLAPALNSADATTKSNAESEMAMIRMLRSMTPDHAQRLIGTFQVATQTNLYIPAANIPTFQSYGQKIAEALAAYKVPEAVISSAEPLMAFMANDHFLTRDDQPLLARISVPTLVINGKDDGLITPKTAEAVHDAIKGSQLLVLENCGHFPFVEQSEKTTAAILDFVKAHNR